MLLTKNPLTAKEISGEANVPHSKIYTVLKKLLEKGFVRETGDRPARFYPVHPRESLRKQRLRIEEETRRAEETVLRELQPIFERTEVREKPEIWIIRGKENILSKIKSLCLKSRSEFLLALPQVPRDMVEEILRIVKKFVVERDILPKIMTTEENYMLINELDVRGEIKTRDIFFGGGLIVDGKEALLLLSEAKLEDLIGIWSRHIGLTVLARDYFIYLWGKGELKELTEETIHEEG